MFHRDADDVFEAGKQFGEDAVFLRDAVARVEGGEFDGDAGAGEEVGFAAAFGDLADTGEVGVDVAQCLRVCARAFAQNVADFGLPILMWDERWSTQAVERAMIDADMSRAKRAERVDSAAAAFILQGAIDAMAG